MTIFIHLHITYELVLFYLTEEGTDTKILIIWPLGLLVNGRNMNTDLLITDYKVSSSFLGGAIETDNKTNIY